MRRRRLLPFFLFNFILWTGWLYLVIKFSPDNTFFLSLFFLLLFFALGFTLSIVFKDNKQGFLFSTLVSLFLLLRLLKMANILNLVILFSLFLTLQIYLRQGRKAHRSFF